MFNDDVINEGQKEAEKEKPRLSPGVHKVEFANIEFKESKKGSPMFVLDVVSDKYQGFKEYVVTDESENGKKNQVKLAKWFKMAFGYSIESPKNAITIKEAGELVALQLQRFKNLPFLAAILVKDELATKDDPEKGLIMFVSGKRSLYSVTAIGGEIDIKPEKLHWKLKGEDQARYEAYRAQKEAEWQKKKAAFDAKKKQAEQPSNEETSPDLPNVEGEDDLPF